jgi:uncharacterized protein YqhQ
MFLCKNKKKNSFHPHKIPFFIKKKIQRKKKIHCKQLWDVSRKDNSEGFLLTMISILTTLILFPIFLSCLMLVNKISGNIKKSFSSTLVPLDVLLSVLFVVSLYSFIKQTRKILSENNNKDN